MSAEKRGAEERAAKLEADLDVVRKEREERQMELDGLRREREERRVELEELHKELENCRAEEMKMAQAHSAGVTKLHSLASALAGKCLTRVIYREF